MKCFVYRNLHKPGVTYSIKALEGEYKGRVIGYASELTVVDPLFVVREAGRQQVLQTQRKNVHAGIIGRVGAVSRYEDRLPTNIHRSHLIYFTGTNKPVSVTYNPYKYATFVNRETKEAVLAARLCVVNGAEIDAYVT